jgi:hypothetical protein
VPIRRVARLNVVHDPDRDTRGHRHPAFSSRGRAPRRDLAQDGYREIVRGELPAIHIGRQLRIDPTDLNQYLGRVP